MVKHLFKLVKAPWRSRNYEYPHEWLEEMNKDTKESLA